MAMAANTQDITVETGGLIPVSGYYCYMGHRDGDDDGCFISMYARDGLFFREGERMPDLIACRHVILWKITTRPAQGAARRGLDDSIDI